MNLFTSARLGSPALAKIANVLMFNVSWFAILLTQSSFIAPVIVLLHVSAHFYLMGKEDPNC